MLLCIHGEQKENMWRGLMAIDRTVWPRAFAHVDMSAFFASIEQLDFPELLGQPVAVVNGDAGTTIITSSYEAREFGIKTGTKVRDALEACPHLIVRPARSERYAEISARVMGAMESITPDIEIYSVDECWLELTHALSLYGSMEEVAARIKAAVSQASSGLSCSIGISEGKLTAKFCGEIEKGGITIVSPLDIPAVIGEARVDEICGIGRNIVKYLNAHGVFFCKDFRNKPASILSRRFGAVGLRLYSTCLGHDPQPLLKPQAPKSMGHGKVMPPNTKDANLVESTLRYLCEKLAARLRTNAYQAQDFFIGIKLKSGWVGVQQHLSNPTHDSSLIWFLAKTLLDMWDRREGVFKLQVSATRLLPSHIQQLNLFDESKACAQQLRIDQIKDAINQKFGSRTIQPGNMLLDPRKNFTVISPAWRPSGVRNTLDD